MNTQLALRFIADTLRNEDDAVTCLNAAFEIDELQKKLAGLTARMATIDARSRARKRRRIVKRKA